MIRWQEAFNGERGLRIYRIEADAGSLTTGSGGGAQSPLDLLLAHDSTDTTRHIAERFRRGGSPVAESAFCVACHVISLPELVFVTDSTFRTTADHVFPEVLEQIARAEGRRLGDRPLQVLYTHAHFDHAGGYLAVEQLGSDVEILTHPFTPALVPWVSRREGFLRTKSAFLRDCGISADLDALAANLRERFYVMAAAKGIDLERAPWGSDADGPMRVDRPVDPADGVLALAGGRVELFRFDGHLPGHLCVWVDRAHFVSGDMWLPATTSLVTPGRIAALADVPAERCGVLRYLESNERLLALPIDDSVSYPSHEIVFRNPKRMAMRDLEVLAERMAGVERVLAEHRRTPMRVLDLAWGGRHELPLWKLGGSVHRLAIAHEEATSYMQDLLALGDLEEVAPERFLWTGRRELAARIEGALARARSDYGHLEFRSRGAA
jgi:glyoxylase-like metal-dependent hydrolase (beta-lactamase superfamily II)